MIPAAGQLIRYNFLEIFIRLADQKFLKSGICNNWSDAIDKLMNDHLKGVFIQTDSNIWRKKVLWREENDLSIKRQYKTLQRLFE